MLYILTGTDGVASNDAAREVIKRHQEWLRDEKGLDPEDEQITYVLAVAKEMRIREEKAS